MRLRKLVVASILSLFLLVPLTAQANGWESELELYLMATSIDGDTSIGRVDGAEVDVEMSDILKVLNMAGMIHFETVHKSGWGTVIDYSFMDLGEDISGDLGVVDVNVRQGVLQADLLYRSPVGKGTIDYLAGIRWWDNDYDLEVDPAVMPGSRKASMDVDWVDLYIGARWNMWLNEKFQFSLRGDIGGFGLESDFTGAFAANVKWVLSDSWLLDIGYKATWVDYEDGTRGQPGYYSYDTVTHGPMLGLIYKF